MTPLLKTLIGTGIAGGAAGLSVGGYYLLKPSEPKTLSEKFKRKGLKILDLSSSSKDEATWTQKLSTYNGSDHTSKRFPNLPSTNDATIQQQQLINECKKHLDTNPKEIRKTQDLEEKVEFWCTTSKN